MKLTRLGHSMFRIDTQAGLTILIDPWLEGNPVCPSNYRQTEKLREIDLILVTHGHFDHTTGIHEIAEANPDVHVIAQYDLGLLFAGEGIQHLLPLNIGGTEMFHGVKITMVSATHSSSYREKPGSILSAGSAAGYIVELENGYKIYFSGDTGLNADMFFIRDFYKPDLTVLSVGNRFTMDPETACYAVGEVLKAKHVIPCHDFPSPDLAPNREVMRQFLSDDPATYKQVDKSQEFQAFMRDKYPHIRVTVLQCGQTLDLTQAY